MKVSAVGMLRFATFFMVFVILAVPARLVIVPIIAQIGLIVALTFMRRRPPKPIDFSSSTWTVSGDYNR